MATTTNPPEEKHSGERSLGDQLDKVADELGDVRDELHKAAERARTLETIVRSRSPRLDQLENEVEKLKHKTNH